jgi:hypothetical protein
MVNGYGGNRLQVYAAGKLDSYRCKAEQTGPDMVGARRSGRRGELIGYGIA